MIVAAQAGFIGGPRLLASMAQDSWMPRWFANLSERLATHNGILLMGIAALAALWYTHGDVYTLVIMYSINVFVTFSLSMIGMSRHWYSLRKRHPLWRRRLALFLVGGVLCVSILVITVCEKFDVGAWKTVAATGVCVGLCFLIHRYYDRVGASLRLLDETLGQLPATGEPNMAEPDPDRAGGRDPGGRLQRPGHPYHAQRHPLCPRPLQELRVRLGGRDRHGQFQGQRRGRVARTTLRRVAAKVRRPRPAAGNALDLVLLGRHRRGRRIGAHLPGDRPQVPQGHVFRRPIGVPERHLAAPAAAQPNGLFAATPPAMGRRADGDLAHPRTLGQTRGDCRCSLAKARRFSELNMGETPGEFDNAPAPGANGPAPEPPRGDALGIDGGPLPESEEPTLSDRVKTLIIGKPRDLADQSIFKHVSLVAFLAWVGLGADGLSSSCYGPAEAFKNLHGHHYLAVFLALAIAATVFIISTCYSHIIEVFPSGGGGYLVASKLLGPRVGVVSGCALLVDYVLTITVSISAAGEALFGLMGPRWYDSEWKLYAEFAAIVLLIFLNLRGVKESVQVLMPIFLVFLLTHFILIVGSLLLHVPAAAAVTTGIAREVHADLTNPSLGLFWMLGMLLHAYSLGAGTYTGIEAVSNSMPVMREPRVATAKRTMRYMAFSLALDRRRTDRGLPAVGDPHDRTKPRSTRCWRRRSSTTRASKGIGWARDSSLSRLLSEGALLFVAAQAGFIDGPRVLANMAHDSWMPRWFSNLSERLATHNGILLMGIAALGALVYTHGSVYALVIMYSINVFLTFSLSMIGMCRHWFMMRRENRLWRRRLALFLPERSCACRFSWSRSTRSST